MRISLVAAMANGRVIGRDGKLPWDKLPSDMKHFRALTLDKPVIMGRKTFESIGKPLERRVNIVVTSKKPRFGKDMYLTMHPIREGLLFAPSIQKALNSARFIKEEEVMVIGGASIYKQFLPIADKIYLTLVDVDIEGDTFFPRYSHEEWQVEDLKIKFANRKDPYNLSFVEITRKSS